MGLACSGLPNRFLTLTVNPEVGSSPGDRLRLLSHAWHTLAKRLRRAYGPKAIEYLAVVEKTKRGEPHLHILLRSPFLPQKLISDAMRELINAPVVDIRKIRRARDVAAYVAKYVTKAPHHFDGAKRYWHTPGYEVDKEDWKPPEDTSGYRWKVTREGFEYLARAWTWEGFAIRREGPDQLYAVHVGLDH